MIQRDMDIIKDLLNKEIENGSIEDLKKIREIVNSAIDKKEQKRANIYDVLDLLKMDFKVFLYNELDSISLRCFKPGAMTAAIRKVRKYDKSRRILVYDAVGVGKNKLVQQQGVGDKTVLMLERILNKYDLSLDTALTFDERSIYYKNIEDEEKGKKAI